MLSYFFFFDFLPERKQLKPGGTSVGCDHLKRLNESKRIQKWNFPSHGLPRLYESSVDFSTIFRSILKRKGC